MMSICPAVYSTNWQVNGFIGQGYVNVQDSQFIVGDDEDTFDITEAALTVSWTPLEHFRLASAVRYRQWGTLAEENVSFDYLLAEYKRLTHDGHYGIRGGLFKSEAGFYTSTRDVSFTRPSIILPQSVYSDFFRDALLHIKGADLFGVHSVFSGSLEWHVNYGQSDISSDLTRNLVGSEQIGSFEADDYFSADLEYQDDRLRLGFTYFDASCHYQSALPQIFSDGSLQAKNWLASVQYRFDRFEITAEYIWGKRYIEGMFVPTAEGERQVDSDGYYVDVRAYLPKDIEVFLRYGQRIADNDDPDGKKFVAQGLPEYYGYANEWTIGSRWFPSKNWLVAVEYHRVEGAAWVPPILSANPQVQQKDWSLFAVEISYKFQW
jgi:hypothetical protein